MCSSDLGAGSGPIDRSGARRQFEMSLLALRHSARTAGIPELFALFSPEGDRRLWRERVRGCQGFFFFFFWLLGLFVSTLVIAFGHGLSFQNAAIRCRNGMAMTATISRLQSTAADALIVTCPGDIVRSTRKDRIADGSARRPLAFPGHGQDRAAELDRFLSKYDQKNKIMESAASR